MNIRRKPRVLPDPWSPGCKLQAQTTAEPGWAAAAGTQWLRPGFEVRTAAGAPHLRVVATEPDRPCQGHPAVLPPAPGCPPSPGRPCFRSLRQRRPPGRGRRLGRRVFGLRLERVGCTAVPGGGRLGLIRRWTRSPGNGRGYGAPQRPNRAASLRAGSSPEVGLAGDPVAPQAAHFPILYNFSPRKFIYPAL